MGFAELLQPVADTLVDFFGDGETLELRALRRLFERGTGIMVADGGFEVAANAALGATSLTIQRPAVGKLGGDAPQGLSVAIAGDATSYITTVPATANVDQLVVSIDPPLAAPAAAGSQVTLGAYASYVYPRARTSFRSQDIDGERIRSEDTQFVLSATSGQPAPEEGMLVPETGDEVVHVETVAPGAISQVVAWILHVGSRR